MSDLEIIPFVVAVVLGCGLLAFWIVMLVDCLKHEARIDHNRLIWVLVILFGKFVGAAVYFFMRYRPRRVPQATDSL